LACGILAANPDEITGVTIMKMIRSTNMMSIIGTTLGSDLTVVFVPTSAPIRASFRMWSCATGQAVS
jgi:hypothetical protein